MAGQLNQIVIGEFEKCFRTNCLTLVGEAYNWICENRNVSIDWDEEAISANIFTHIDESEEAIACNISISDECRLYNKDILENRKKAKAAPRIDLKLSTNWMAGKKRFSLYIEAKNIIENNSHKANRKSAINAMKVRSRYISTGMDNFLLGDYPQNGFMLAYILEGKLEKIINYLNDALTDDSRQDEILVANETDIPYLETEYISEHRNGYKLSHFFLNFCEDVTHVN